ncbi:MAG: toprim domain-containing protein [Bacteroidales bacterium]|nr:toprim domain-containing protein [Bacteroidales bacterium]
MDAKLTYRDYQQRISIQDVLLDAGYRQNRKDGLRYPSYSRVGSDGRRVSGDKFIVTRNGLCCFRPPEQKNYNVISFIKSFPENFSDYRPGMDKDRLVNLVCRRLLNCPIEERISPLSPSMTPQRPFDMDQYDNVGFFPGAPSTWKPFYPYFKARGINLDTQNVFSGYFLLSTGPKGYTNLTFPLTLPNDEDKVTVVGLEERGRPNKDGKTYKGLAKDSDASRGLWIARLANHQSQHGPVTPLKEVEKVYWFESAYDAMAYYQLHKKTPGIGDAVFVSTSGNPSRGQQDGMARVTPDATHVLCFDADEAGEKFARNFYTTHPELRVVRAIPDPGYKDWNEQLLGELKREQYNEVDQPKGCRR